MTIINKKGYLMKTIITIIALVLCVLVSNVSARNTYQPVFYPNSSNLARYVRGPVYSNIEDARAWVYSQHERIHQVGCTCRVWDYEIGKNCKYDKRFGDIQVCEETLR